MSSDVISLPDVIPDVISLPIDPTAGSLSEKIPAGIANCSNYMSLLQNIVSFIGLFHKRNLQF